MELACLKPDTCRICEVPDFSDIAGAALGKSGLMVAAIVGSGTGTSGGEESFLPSLLRVLEAP